MTHDLDHQWLGIHPSEQPAHHYRLLGVALFESHDEVIRNAADRQMQFVRKLCRGPFEEPGQDLLDRLAAAKLCLLKPERKAEYDAQLRKQLDAEISRDSEKDAPRMPTARDGTETPAANPTDATDEDIANKSVSFTGNSVSRSNAQPPNSQPPNSQPTAAPLRSPWDPMAHQRASWIVGYDANCDVVVDSPLVSKVHCKISQRDGNLLILDLQSTNGTFVNRQRIKQSVPIAWSDLVTLGRDTRLRFPPFLLRLMGATGRVAYLGRSPANDIVLNHPSVSTFHARLVELPDQIILEDLGSTNHTWLVDQDGRERRVTSHAVRGEQTIRLGDSQHLVASLLAQVPPG